jgi:dTDP-glucose 4,6-dehydratase
MKILVTGGAGFIGANFVQYWVKNHPADQVVVLDALTYAGNLENLESVKNRITFIKGDICDPAVVDQAMAGCEVLVHFAAESHVDRSILDPSSFIKTNVFGTYTLLEAARKHGIKRFHHVSTDEVFGHIPLESRTKFNEQTAFAPRSPYAASKAASDHLVSAYFHTYGLPITISNCSNNFGPYMFPEKLIPLAITNLLEGKKVPVYTPGNQVRDWLYVEDHCRAIEIILQKGRIGETYCVGAMHDEVTNVEVVKKILKLLGKNESMIEFVKDRPGHDVKYAVDWSKIQTELSWRPQHNFDEWLVKTVDWYKEHRPWWERVKSGEYQKYYQVQYINR